MSEIFRNPFRMEEVDNLRQQYADGDESIRFDLSNALGGDDVADAVLEGPDKELVQNLKDNPEDIEYDKNFDNVFGLGAAEYYRNQKTMVEKATEAVKTVASGAMEVKQEIDSAVVYGIADAATETVEFAHNTAEDIQDVVLGDNNEQLIKRIEREKHGLAEMEKNYSPDHPAAKVRKSVIDKKRERIAEMEATLNKGGVPERRIDISGDDILGGIMERPDTLAGNLLSGVVQFGAGMAIPGGSLAKLQWVAKGAPKAKYAASLIAGFVSDATAFDPETTSVTQFVSEYFDIPENVVTDFMTKDPDDPQILNRFKAGIEGAGLDAIGATVFATVRGIARIKKGVTTPEQAREEVIQQVEQVKVEDPSASITPEEMAEQITQKPELQRKQNEVAAKSEELTRTEEPIDEAVETTLPKRPTVEENAESVKKAAAFVKNENKLYFKAIKDAEEKILKPDGNLLDDAPNRTNVGQAKEAKRTFSLILRHAESNGEGNWKQLIAWANRKQSDHEKLITITAFRKATEAAEVRYKAILRDFKIARKAGGFNKSDMAAIEMELDHAATVYFGLRSIDQDLGSNTGRQLQARKSTVDMDEVKVEKGSPAPTKKTLEKAGARAEAEEVVKGDKKGIAGFDEKAEYERLRLVGFQPSDALDLIELTKRELSVAPPIRKAREKGERTLTEKLFEFSQAVRYGSMLSGLATHIVNFSTSTAHAALLVGSELVNPATTRFAMDRSIGMAHSFKESAHYAWKAAKEMEPVLSAVAKMDYDHVTKNIFITLFPRMMLGVDEMMRQVWYRGEITARAMKEARMVGMDAEASAKHVQERLAASLEDGKALDRVAESHASAIPFQRSFNSRSKYVGERTMAGIQRKIDENKLLTLLFPFSRVSMDLLDVGTQMTPGLNKLIGYSKELRGQNSRFLDDIRGLNGEFAKTRARAYQYGGYAISSMILMLAMEGKITGGGSYDYKEQNLQKESGQQKYTINIGDKQIPFDRLEPFATPIKVIANMVEWHKSRQWEYDHVDPEDPTIQDRVYDTLLGSTYTFAEMLSSQPYAEGMEDLFEMLSEAGSDQLGEGATRFAQGFAESYVPNILKKINQARAAHEGEYINREWSDVFTRHFSSWVPDYEGDLRRSAITGEVMKLNYDEKFQRWQPYSSIPIKHKPGAEILQEGNKYYGSEFYLKQPTAFNGLPDLRKEKASDADRSLYDRYLEIFSETVMPEGSRISGIDVAGLRYSEALEVLAGDETFNALPWKAEGVDLGRLQKAATKKQMIMDIKKEYQKVAEFELAQVDTNFQELLRLSEEAEYLQRGGEHSALKTLGISK